MHHKLKTLPCYFERQITGEKTFEIRNNRDRGFNAGDTVTFIEWNADSIYSDKTTGREINGRITYVTNYEQRPDYVVFESEKDRSYCKIEDFMARYKLKPTRPITWQDVRKLLAEHGVIYFKCLDDEVWRLDNTPGLWYRPPATFEKMQFSHNPFADNPVIIGPNVVDGEGL